MDADKVYSLIERAIHDLTPLGTKAAQIAFQVTQIQCISYIVYGFMWLLFMGLVVAVLLPYAIRHWHDDLDQNPFPVVAVVLSGFATLGVVISTACLCNVWEWVGIWNPQLFLAHEVLDKVLSN